MTNRRPTDGQPTVDRRPIHDVRASTTFQTMLNHSRYILASSIFAFNSFIKFSNFPHFLTFRTSNFARVDPHLKVYGGANPLACASSLTFLRHRNSQKDLLILENSRFSQKNSRKYTKSSERSGVFRYEYFVLEAGDEPST